MISFQEPPRSTAGWEFQDAGGWHFHSFREEQCWRGVGVGYRSADWVLMRKRATPKGIWVRLRRREDGVQLWCGSTYFTQGATKEVHAMEVQSMLNALPATTLPVLYGSDSNTPVKWVQDEEGHVLATGPEGKGDNMLTSLHEKGITLTPPARDQWRTPTSRPRNQEATGRQIDMVGCKHSRATCSVIYSDSYMLVGSDHEAISQEVHFRQTGGRKVTKPSTRPRRVTREVVLPQKMDQKGLERLAKTSTKPYSSEAYVDPEHVKVCFQIARRGRQAEAWKRALRERAVARAEWRERHIEAATKGDWGSYRTVMKKGATGWEDFYASETPEEKDPHGEVHQHLQNIYNGPGVPPLPEGEYVRCEDFKVAELREALQKGHLRKSVGIDMVPHELLLEIGKSDEGAELMVQWFNRLLHGEENFPESWGKVVMVLIPKIPQPKTPKHLRPICLAAAADKLYSRMLLERTRTALKYSGPAQTMGEGRQTTDYLWAVNRLMALEQEWRKGVWFIKLDLEKAFDRLDRGQFLQRLEAKLGRSEVLRSWWSMLQNTEAELVTAWGRSIVGMRSGIRQGAVESPQMFATAIDWVLEEVAREMGWDPARDVFEGMGVAEVAFVDDMLLWNGTKAGLGKRVEELSRGLLRWGLKLNIQKCQVYASPYSRESGPLQVAGEEIAVDDHLQVMGVPFRVGITAREALAPLFTKVKGRFWAMKHLLRARTPLVGRLKLMNKVLGNMTLWCSSAFYPDRLSLQAMNTLQSQLVIWIMKLSKGKDEDWVSFRIRGFRAARYAILRFLPGRWSTAWLERSWNYAGHRARAQEWECPPASAILNTYRDLEWWEQQQGQRFGIRHPHRFRVKLMGEEREMEEIAGGRWREVAHDRETWRDLRTKWIQKKDLPWASHVQLALE